MHPGDQFFLVISTNQFLQCMCLDNLYRDNKYAERDETRQMMKHWLRKTVVSSSYPLNVNDHWSFEPAKMGENSLDLVIECIAIQYAWFHACETTWQNRRTFMAW